MDTSMYDAEIQQLDKTILAKRSELENLSKAFQEATRKYLDLYYQSQMDKEVEEKSSVSISLGTEGLKKIKTELSALKTQIPELIEKHLNTNHLWPHRSNDPKVLAKGIDLFNRYSNKANEGIDRQVRILLGYFGKLLERHGYIKYDQQGEWEKDYGSENPRYRYGYDWSKEMNEVLKLYSSSYEEYYHLIDKVDETKKKKSSAQAKDLWSKA